MNKKPCMSSPSPGEVWLVDLGYVAKARPYHNPSCKAFTEDGEFDTRANGGSGGVTAFLVGI